MSGARSYHAGLAAEDAVLRHYAAKGGRLLARRWRGRAGEIDLIVAIDTTTVFVEVKASRTISRAAARLGGRQAARIAAAAEEYLAASGRGLAVPARIDVALVDGVGRVEIIENALMA